MQSVQRRFGRLTTTRADDSQVAVLLKDFDDADTLLSRVGTDIISPRVPQADFPDCRFYQGLARRLGVHCHLPEPYDR